MRGAGLALGALLAVGCRAHVPEAARTQVKWLVVAPHPDDETLVAGGVLARAAEAHESAAVVVMTNGDWDCVHDGLLREGESVAGLRALGLPEDRVFFLGYPDGGLPRLGVAPLRSKRIEGGACALGATTYGTRGRPLARGHALTREDAVRDLAAVLAELAPEDVVVTHPSDTHPDHATTYALLRDALERAPQGRAPRVHRAIVHNGDCWPTGPEPREPCPPAHVSVAEPTPPLSGRLLGYAPRERIPVPASCRVPDRATNPKLLAIAAHASQTRAVPESYLFSFARADEAFFPETYARRGGHLDRTPAARPATTTRAVVARGGELAAGGYRLAFGDDAATLRKAAAAEPLQVWPLPHDAFGRGDEPVEVTVDPRDDDGVVEISFRLRDALVGVAVDVSASPSARPAP